jgi:restriction endonuclease Mrr
MASSPSTSTSTTAGTYSTIATSASPSWIISNGTLNSFSDIHLSDETRDILLETLKEDELDEILEKVKSRSPELFETLIKDFVRNRHFTEPFLLKYVEYLSKDTIHRRHKEHLISGDYPTLSLLLLARE